MERKAVIICPSCHKIRKFGEWIELSYSERLLFNPLTIEELSRTCDACEKEEARRIQLASNA